jgi:hypothetical protein
MQATGPIQKQRMLEAYGLAVQDAFTEEIIQSGWKKTGIWPPDPSQVLEDTELFPPTIPSRPITPPQPKDQLKVIPFTPETSKEYRDQVSHVLRQYPGLPRDVSMLLKKGVKTIDLMSVEIATTHQDNFILDTELGKYKPDKRQTVEKDPNKVFSSLPDIRSAQDKLEKRLREMPHEDQLPIDSFVTMTPSTRKKARRRR